MIEPGFLTFFYNIFKDLKKKFVIKKNAKSPSERLQSLHNSIFVTCYRQGERTDRGMITLTVESDNTVTGDYQVYYERKNGEKIDYPEKPDNLTVRGNLYYDRVLLLNWQTTIGTKHHVGSFLLEYDNEKLFGKYIVYYESVPADRKGDYHLAYDVNQSMGEIEYWPCNTKQAKEFMADEINIEDIKRSKKIY